MNEKELATVLAALRYFQKCDFNRTAKKHMFDHFDDVEPMTNDEIDELCEELNTVEPDQMPICKSMDWKLLREQKAELLNRIDDSDLLMGIVHLIDGIQDHAVDVLGYDEKEIFNLEQE